MDEIAANILKVYETLKPASPFLSTAIDFSPRGAGGVRRDGTARHDTSAAASAKAAKLIKRKTVHLWKIAGVLAVMNGEHEISLGAFEAALAWAEYGQRHHRRHRLDGAGAQEDENPHRRRQAGARSGQGAWAPTRVGERPRRATQDPVRQEAVRRRGRQSLADGAFAHHTWTRRSMCRGTGVKNKRAVIRLNAMSAEVDSQGATDCAFLAEKGPEWLAGLAGLAEG